MRTKIITPIIDIVGKKQRSKTKLHTKKQNTNGYLNILLFAHENLAHVNLKTTNRDLYVLIFEGREFQTDGPEKATKLVFYGSIRHSCLTYIDRVFY